MALEQNEKDFWVIGIGASAGGLEALSLFFKSLPSKPHAAFVVAQHLAPHSKSMMVELIGRQAQLPVVSVQDHLRIEPGIISIVPPNFDVTLFDGELRLSPAGSETRPKPSVDTFLQSLAKVFGRRAVGIILSGTGSDGAEGMRAIKENGGITIVQDSESAKYDGMPKSALETGLIDVVLPPDKIAEQLSTILESRQNNSLPMMVIKPQDEESFHQIIQHLKKEIGADFSQYKISTIQRRIGKRLGILHIKSLKDYFHYLQETPGELATLSQNMLVSVTSFFRDIEAFEAMARHLEDIISKKNVGDDLRIWSAGCATGEEPYSIAIIVHEILQKVGKPLSVKIFATDLDHEALANARSGFYSSEDVKGLAPAILEKYFDKREKYFEVKKTLKDSIVFARQDIIQNPPFVKIDLISCRNVLIYFDSNLQNRVFEIFHYALRPSGLLFLGKSESVNNNLFDVVDRKEKIFKRLNVVSKFTYSGRYTVGANHHALAKRKVQASFADTAPLQMLKMFNLAGVVVDEETTILHIIGEISDYMALPTGMADFRLNNLLNRNALVEFSVLLKKASKEGQVLKSRSYKVESNDKKSFSFTVKALDIDEATSKQLYLVAFEPKASLEEEVHLPSEVTIPQRIIELEQELSATRENLQTVIEEIEVSNEELQSLNEELSSTNEELQASNEELETTNEELQSTNEELITLNEELGIKSSELRLAYSSLDNIQSSLNFPIIVIDKNRKVLRYNPVSNQIFNFSVSDLGQPITQVSCQCEIPHFEEKIEETMATGRVTEIVCETPQKIYQLRIHPSRDENKKILGAILIFFDNTEFMNTQDKLRLSDKRIRSIMDGSPTLITLKDNHGKYLMVNKAFTQFFNTEENDLLGKTDREIFSEEVSSQFRENDLEVLLKRISVEKEESIILKEGKRYLLSNRFPLFGPHDRNPYAVGTVSLDITAQVMAKKELSASESRYKAIIEDQAVFVCRHLPDGKITFVNHSFLNYFGGTKDNHVKDFMSLVEKKDQARITLDISKINLEHPIVQYEFKVSEALPVKRWVRWIHRGIFNDDGGVIEYQAVGFDVTDIHNQTADLLAKENLYTHVLEYTSDYLSVYRCEDGQFYLESFNQSTAYYRGFGSHHFIGKSLTDLIDPSQAPKILAKYQKSVETNSISTFEESIEGPGGLLYLSTTIVPIHDSVQNITRVVGLSRDITKLKKIEKALRDEKKNAESANTAKSDFLASMSHELRTPLNVIMGMSQLLLRGKVAPENVRLVESIQRSGKVLLSLIEDVLDLSKIEAGKIRFEARPLDMEQLVTDVVQSFASEAERKKISLNLDYKVKPNTPLIGDEVRIKQVIMNLIGNALKFTEKGSVSVSVSLQSKSFNMNALYFEIKDTGIGIPEEAYPKIFKRFSQADSGTTRKFGGTGLGLAICKELVELMKGSIGFESVEGEGSTFWFKIELPEAVEDSEPSLDPAQLHVDFSKLKVLAVDDNPESLKVLHYFFEDKKGYLDIAESGYEALGLIDKENYDLVLMDMQMPGLDGMETTRKIRARKDKKSNLVVVALTANAMASDRKNCLDAGMNDFLTKPIDFDGLIKILNKWTAQ